TTEGIRRDTVWSYDAGSPMIDPTTGVAVGGPTFYPKFVSEQTQDSKNWGVVVHSPQYINKYLPFNSTISLTYSYSDNFKATAQRYNSFGSPLGPETGRTREWGGSVTMFGGLFELRVVHYNTADALSSSLINVGGNISNLVGLIGNTIDTNALGINNS